jgi:hypothetical protein
MRIHKKDMGDILDVLPDMIPFDSKTASDFIICTLGFEDRTHKILDELLIYPRNHKNLIVVKYPTNQIDNEKNRLFIEKAKLNIENVFEIEYERSTFFERFVILLSEAGADNSNVIFDISTCSSYLFYPIFKALIDLDISLKVCYCEAAMYYPNKEEWEKVEERAKAENSLFIKSWDEADFQSIGVDDVYYSNLFYDMNPDNKPSKLIAVPNFNSIRMQTIKERDFEINKTDPNSIIWLIGVPPDGLNDWRTDAMKRTNLLGTVSSKNLQYVSTLVYKETINSLEEIWENNKYSTHISIGSLGSKMQHLGTFLFIYLHPDVGLWLAEPREFKAQTYSEGTGKIYEINFGSMQKLKSKLSSFMKFEWQF